MFLDFRDLLHAMRQQYRMIVVAMVIGLVVGLAYLLFAEKQYTATAGIVFQTRSQKVSNIEAVLPGLSSDRAEVESQIEILTSPRVFDRAIALIRGKPRTAKNPDAGEQPTGSTGSDEVLQILAEATSSETALDQFRERLKTERRGLSYIVDVSFTHSSPRMAADMANAIVDAYIDIQRGEKIRATKWASQQLQGRVRTVGQEVQEVLAKLQKFKSENGLIKIGEQEVGERLLSDHINKLVDAKVKAIQAETTAQEVKASAGDPDRLTALSNVLQSEVILEFRRQYAEVKRQLGQDVSRYGENHVTVANDRAQLANLEKEIDREIERLIKSSLNEADMARKQVELLTKGMEDLEASYASRNDARIELSELERQATAKQQLYVSLFNRLLETEIQVGLQADDARINAYAEAPERPSWPRNKLTLAVLLLGGGIVGTGLALLRETFNTIFRSGRDVAAFTGLAPVAEFPQVALAKGFGAVLNKARGKRTALIDHTRFDPGSMFTRSLVKFRRWVHAARSGEHPAIILVTSAHDGDGKSTVASNLAQIEGHRGRSVLLIDCSGGAPESVEGARLERYPVVYDAESQASDMGPSTGRAKLVCLRYSGADYDKAFCDPQTIADETILGHLAEAGERYDTVILDTPSLMSFAHTTSLIEYCDCAVFVIRAGETTHDDYLQSFGQFVDPSIRPVGLVLNMAGREKPRAQPAPRDPGGNHPAVTQSDREHNRESRKAKA